MKFSRETKAFLKEAGWFPDRVFDAAGFERGLRKAGYPVYGCVLKLLRSFGGLFIGCHAQVGSTSLEYFHFSVPKALRGWKYEPNGFDFQVTGKNLCMIGENWEGRGKLKMDEDGVVYAVAEAMFFRVAESAEEAIETLCRGGPYVELPVPPP